jgi:DNA-binding PadR family transcriptional regulator
MRNDYARGDGTDIAAFGSEFGVLTPRLMASNTLSVAPQPCLTHLQALGLSRIAIGDHPKGKTIRMFMENNGIKQSLPAFYLLMGRLDENGYVVTETHTRRDYGQTLNERSYEITEEGRRQLISASTFYESLKKLQTSNSNGNP